MTVAKKGPVRKRASRKSDTAPDPRRASTNLVARVSADVTPADHVRVVAPDVNDLGHPNGEEIRSLAHIYTPWGDVRSNGSGIVALAAWSKRLEEEGIASADGRDLTPYIRGLIHR